MNSYWTLRRTQIVRDLPALRAGHLSSNVVERPSQRETLAVMHGRKTIGLTSKASYALHEGDILICG